MPASTYIGQHLYRGQYKRKCKGGPWDGLEAVLPRQSKDQEWSLVIRVGKHIGQYNLNTGEWREKK